MRDKANPLRIRQKSECRKKPLREYGELTPTMKLKIKVINQKYKLQIDNMNVE